MKGRLEHKLKNEQLIQNILSEMPDYVADYYYSRASAKESKGSSEYIKKIRNFLEYIDNDVKKINIAQITERDIAMYLKKIETKYDKFGNQIETSYAYRKMIHSVLKSFFTYLYHRGLIEKNPMEFIQRPVAVDKVQRKQLGLNDLHLLLTSVSEDKGCRKCCKTESVWAARDKAILTLFIVTGMRRTALIEINIDDLNFDTKEITVIDKRRKTHVYKMNNMLESALLQWLSERSMFLNDVSVDALFISNQKTRLSEMQVSRIVHKYSEQALGVSLSPHKLRAAFCTILYQETGDIEFVRDAVGHANIATTQLYIVKKDNAKEKATSVLETLLNDNFDIMGDEI